MRQIENFMNWLTDMDWGWWPVISFRPPKERDIDNRVLFKISPVFGGAAGLILLLLFAFRHFTSITAGKAVLFYLAGCGAFFLFYKFTFAYFWNRRAKRLRMQTNHETAA